MNKDWLDFLKSNKATIINDVEVQFSDPKLDEDNAICAVVNKGILKVSGDDAKQFLQGQLTCNIKELNDTTSFFAAFCNAKGRTISTLLIIKNNDNFLLILPKELIEKVTKKLQMYVLRAKVTLENVTEQFCLIGVTSSQSDLLPHSLNTDFEVNQTAEIIIKLPSSASPRYLLINSVSSAPDRWIELSNKAKLTPCNSSLWDFLDISTRLAWLTTASSEEYIPQMLNIDKLGGISFNKGCYTGQEIIARTHYLGKAKRELFVAESNSLIQFSDELKVISISDDNPIGTLITSQIHAQKTRMLVVMPHADIENIDLALNNPSHDRVYLIN